MRKSITPIDMENPQPVNEEGELLTTDNIQLMMNLIDLLFLGQEAGTGTDVPS